MQVTEDVVFEGPYFYFTVRKAIISWQPIQSVEIYHSHSGKSQRINKVIRLGCLGISVQIFMSVHPVFSPSAGTKVVTDWHCHPWSYASSLAQRWDKLKYRNTLKERRWKNNNTYERVSHTFSLPENSLQCRTTDNQTGRQTDREGAGNQAAIRNIKAEGPEIPSRHRVLLSPSPSSALRHGPVCFSCSLPSSLLPPYGQSSLHASISHQTHTLCSSYASWFNRQSEYLDISLLSLWLWRAVNSGQWGVILLNGVPSPQMDWRPHNTQIT